MQCKNHNLETTFSCAMCKTELCKECKPVSFQGKVYCATCCEIAENRIYNAEIKKESFSSKYVFNRVAFSAILAACFISFFGYYFFIKPNENIVIPPDDKEVLVFYLNMAYDKGKNSDTYKRQMNNILRLDMSYKSLIAFLHTGEKYLAEKNYKEALINFEKIKNMLSDWDMIYIFTSECFFNLGESDKAIGELKQAIELNINSTKAYMFLGDIYDKQDKIEDAILQYTKAFYIDSKNSSLPLKLAELYLRKNSITKAFEYRNQASKLGANTQNIDSLIQEGNK